MENNLPTILVVEDEESLLKAWVEAFRREGLNVLAASDGEGALNLVLKFEPDLVVVDLVLSSPDGFVLIKKLREHKRVQNTPVVFLSGWLGSESLSGQRQDGDNLSNSYLDNHWSFEQVVRDVKNKLRLNQIGQGSAA